MKKELFFICTAAMLGTVCFTNLTADKASAKTSGDYKYVVTGKKKKTCAIRKYLGKDKDVVVPERIDGYVVTRIGNKAFKGNKKIESVKLSRYITMIGEKSFADCTNLESISLPKKVHTIKKYAFDYCESLDNLTLPANLKTIGKYAFFDCPIKEINIPQHLEKIGNKAFNCVFNSITVDKKNQKYDSRDNCNALIETSSNTLIWGSNNATIPDGVTAIGNSAFYGCDEIKEITIPGSVKKIGGGAFSNCDLLEKVNMSEGLTTIEYGAFDGCDSLKEARLPDSVEKIEQRAFFCKSLEDIYIPKNLKKTADMPYIFASRSVKSITVAEGNPDYDSRDNCNAVIETASNTLALAFDKTVLPDTIKAIGESAFLSTPSELVIPEGVEKLAEYAFYDQTGSTGCRGNDYAYTLNKLTLPSTLKEIGSFAFTRCHTLREIDIPEGVTTLKESTFTDCNNLETINLPSSLTSINKNAFCLYDLKTINYRGSKAQWVKIKIETSIVNDVIDGFLSGVKINYNYKG